MLAIYKKEKKRTPQNHLTQEKAEFLVKLLETTFAKLRYFTDEEWGGDEDDEDGDDEVVTAFLDMRRVRTPMEQQVPLSLTNILIITIESENAL